MDREEDPSTDSPEAPEPPPEPEETSATRSRKRARSAIEWIAVIALALVVAVVLRTFVVQTFWIPSASMDPTLQTNDRVVVNKLSYRLHGVHRGDIVVFTTPLDVAPGYEPVARGYKDLVKRVIGLPGDTVAARNGHVLVNGEPLKESYLANGTRTEDFGPVVVPEGSYWVMGDNRGGSQDSRYFGPIRKRTIVGRAFVRIWPLSRLGFL